MSTETKFAVRLHTGLIYENIGTYVYWRMLVKKIVCYYSNGIGVTLYMYVY